MDLSGQIDTLATSHPGTLAGWGLGQIWTSYRRQKSPAPARSQTADLAHSLVTIPTMLPGCSMHYKQNITENRWFTDKYGSLSTGESMILSHSRCKSSRMWCLITDVLKHPASSMTVLWETTSLQHITSIYKTRMLESFRTYPGRHNVVGTLTRLEAWKSGVQLLAGTVDFSSFQSVETGSRAHAASYAVGTGGSFPGHA